MDDKGWIKLNRQITEHWIFKDAEKLRAWIDILIMANHENNKVYLREGLLVVKRGQFVTSIDKLAKRWHWSRNRVFRFLELLESDGMVKRDCNRYRTLITIVNYGKFQDVRNTNGTTNRTTNGTTGETTNGTRTRNIKNDKECKEKAAPISEEEDYVSEEEWKRRLAEEDDDW